MDLRMLSNVNFWISLAFVSLIVLIYRPMRDLVNKVLTARSEQISKDLTESQAIKLEAQKLLDQCKQQKQKIAIEIVAITARAHEEVESLTQQSILRLGELIKAKEQYIAKRLANQQKAIEQECLIAIIDEAFILVHQKLTTAIANDKSTVQLKDFDQALETLFTK